MGLVIPWTKDEDAALQLVYPRGGIFAAMDALPNRTKQGIYKRANKLDIRSRGPYITGGNRLSPEPDPAIAGAFNQWPADFRGQIFARPY